MKPIIFYHTGKETWVKSKQQYMEAIIGVIVFFVVLGLLGEAGLTIKAPESGYGNNKKVKQQ